MKRTQDTIPVNDFRGRRWLLSPQVFAFQDGPEPARWPPPSDLIPEDDWDQIVHLPDHVAIHTTSYQGSQVASAERAAWLLLKAVPLEPAEANDHLGSSLLDALDDVRAGNFSAIAGYYRLGIASLRTALERVAEGAARKLGATPPSSEDGDRNVNWALRALRTASERTGLNQALDDEFGIPLIDDREQRKAGKLGWVNILRKRLSGYTHAGIGKEHGSLWRSNGPVYVPKAFALFESLALESVAASLLLARLADRLRSLPSRSFEWESRALDWVPIWKRAWEYLEAAAR